MSNSSPNTLPEMPEIELNDEDDPEIIEKLENFVEEVAGDREVDRSPIFDQKKEPEEGFLTVNVGDSRMETSSQGPARQSSGSSPSPSPGQGTTPPVSPSLTDGGSPYPQADTSTTTTTTPQKNGKPGGGLGTSSARRSINSIYSVLAPNYKQKCEDFRKTFKNIPENEKLLVDYSCALQRDILNQGRMYLTQNYICFYANIFRWETQITIQYREVSSITKERTARVIPNALQITTESGDKYFFTSFTTRDKAHLNLFKMWQNALMNQSLPATEFMELVKQNYGEEVKGDSDSGGGCLEDSLDPDFDPQKQLSPLDLSVNSSRTQRSSTPPPLSPCSRESIEGYVEIPGPKRNMSAPTGLTTTYPSTPPGEGMPGGSDDNDIPTDISDNTESEDEAICPCTEHYSKKCINEVYPFSVDKLFQMLFSDTCPFYQDFLLSRKTSNLVIFPWQQVDKNTLSRNMTYTLTLYHNQPIGPKTGDATEIQTYHKDLSTDGQTHVVTSQVENHGIPYADSFRVVNQYCLTRVKSGHTRLKVTSDIKYRKSVMGLIKVFIEKNAVTGIQDNFRRLSDRLLEEASSVSMQPKKRKKRRSHSTNRKDAKGTAAESFGQNSNTDQHIPPGVTVRPAYQIPVVDATLSGSAGAAAGLSGGIQSKRFLRITCLVLLLLLLLNLGLCWRLWVLEDIASRSIALPEGIGEVADWKELIKHQEKFQMDEIHRWKGILNSCIELLDKMQNNLSQLRDGITSQEAVRTGHDDL